MTNTNSTDLQRHTEVLVSTTWDCNLRCSYCFVNKTEITSEKISMTPETAKQVIDALDTGLSDVKRICVHIYGGEPFLNLPAVEALVERALEKEPGRFTFAVTTNGTIINDRILKVLNAIRFTVLVSIDGPEDIHDQCRRFGNGAPSHHRALHFLNTVREKTPCKVYGGAVIRSGWRLRDAYKYLHTLPVHEVKAQAVRLPAGTPFALTDEEWDFYKQDIRAIGESVIKDLEAGRRPTDNRFSGRVLQILCKGTKERFCDAGNTNFGVTPDGIVMPCLLVKGPGTRLGHVSDDPQVWRDAGRKWIDKPLREECKSCKYLNMCVGGCPAITPVCGDEECDIIAANCETAYMIYDHFEDNQEALLTLAGIT